MSLTDELSIGKLKQKIDLQDSATIVNFGLAIQRKTANLVNETLQSTLTYDAKDINKLFAEIYAGIQDFDAESSGGVFGGFTSPKRRLQKLRTKYEKTAKGLGSTRKKLAGQEVALRMQLRKVKSCDQQNRDNSEKLGRYIEAGEQKLAEMCSDLEQVQQDVQELQTQESALAQISLNDRTKALGERLDSLKKTKIAATQLSVQLLAFQKTDEMLLQNVKSIIDVSVPAWQQSIINILAIDRMKDINYDDEQTIVDAEALKGSNTELLDAISKVMHTRETKGG